MQVMTEMRNSIDQPPGEVKQTRVARLTVAILAASLLGSDTVDSGVYKWIDEEGKTHYTDSPPDRAARQMDVPLGPDEATLRSSREQANRLLELDRRKQQMRQRAKAREEREALARRREAEALARRCRNARSHLEILTKQIPVYWTSDRGERVFIEDHERPERIAELKRFIQRDCPD
jgi:hypothetical protein